MLTRKEIEDLRKGEILSDGRGRWVEVDDIGRLDAFNDIEVCELEPNEAEDLVRADGDTILLTAGELSRWSRV